MQADVALLLEPVVSPEVIAQKLKVQQKQVVDVQKSKETPEHQQYLRQDFSAFCDCV